MHYYLGVDVGTGSVRVGLFDASGHLQAHQTAAIKTWRPRANFVEQSSNDIWDAICRCCKLVRADTGIDVDDIRGIGFDATCSLVLVDAAGNGVSVDPDGSKDKNIIVWMDHRAVRETTEINSLGEDGYSVFDYVGGKISPEMQLPKLLWLKRHLPSSWKRAAHFFDLPDYLTFRATGNTTRSLCSLTCKWTYLSHGGVAVTGWQGDFLKAVGLEELTEDEYARVGNRVRPIGEAIGTGLSDAAALELGLLAGTKVGVSIIDAHAGGIGMLGMAEDGDDVDFDRRLALIGGTSSCHMAVASEKWSIPGVWGPYFSAMVPGLWLNEGGQSATGALVDHIINHHGASAAAKEAAEAYGLDIYAFLNKTLEKLANGGSIDSLTDQLHVCPYFHGNRSPRADPSLMGMIAGLKLSATTEDLARLYLATIQAIAYGTRHIIDTMNAAGYKIDTLICCGGGIKNTVFMQQHANVTGCRLLIPEERESVLLGSAMLAAVAATEYESIEIAMASMSRPGERIEPQVSQAKYHARKYTVFKRLYDDQIAYRVIMDAAK